MLEELVKQIEEGAWLTITKAFCTEEIRHYMENVKGYHVFIVWDTEGTKINGYEVCKQ